MQASPQKSPQIRGDAAIAGWSKNLWAMQAGVLSPKYVYVSPLLSWLFFKARATSVSGLDT